MSDEKDLTRTRGLTPEQRAAIEINFNIAQCIRHSALSALKEAVERHAAQPTLYPDAEAGSTGRYFELSSEQLRLVESSENRFAGTPTQALEMSGPGGGAVIHEIRRVIVDPQQQIEEDD